MTRGQIPSPWQAGQYENPVPELTLSPQSGTMNSATFLSLQRWSELEFLKNLWGLGTE